MDISGLEDEYRLAAGKPMLLYLKRPAPDREPRLAAMIDSIRAAGTVSYRAFATPRELERLLADDLAVLLSESFAGAAAGTGASARSPAGPGEAELPAGTVTFLLTDIEGSTRLWETVPEAMEVALERHDSVLTEVIRGHGGVVVTSRGEGDSFFAVFASAVSAVEAAGACQLRLGTEAWPAGAALRVRMGLHTGDAQVQQGDYVDHAPINRCARVKAAAHGGQVLLTKATRDLVGGRLGGGFGLKRLGEFRLRDLAEPELLYQLTHADLPAEFPPLRTVAERAGNLPLPVSSFIGRARELEQTAAALGQARVVTLTGPGGVGKTRLALQAAAQAAPRFGDGAWLCELAPVRDPAGVDDAVAAVFSVSARGGHSTRQALVEFLRGKQLLLVLDNCEHLIEGAAALAGALARSCERLVILATSREALEIDGERLVPVPPLGVPGAGADLAAITDAEAVRLFADRAAAVKPGFAVTAENAAAVAAVVRRLDGIALAIELAAARVPVDDGGRAGPAAGAQFRGARDWPAGSGRTAPDAAGRYRLVGSTCSPGPNRPCWPGWRYSPAAAPCRRLRRSAAGTASIPTRCSSCWRAWWRGRWWWPRKRGSRPATGCWRRSASTARNASRRPGRPSCGGPATPATTRISSDESATTPTTLTRRCSGRCG